MSKRAAQRRKPGRPSTLPARIAPMLAQSAAEPFDSADHLFEIKWDGTRCIAFVEPDRLRLLNRRSVEMRERYPELAGLGKLPPGTVLDGEIVVLVEGKPSFPKLQQRDHQTDPGRIAMLSRRMPATLMAFDLLFVQGRDIMCEPLQDRRRRLEQLTVDLGDPHVVAPSYVIEYGREYFAAAEQHGLEGVMAKRLNSPYTPGKRSPHWVKIKPVRVEPFDVIGYVPREGEPAVSALVLGEQYGGRWVYKGKVGSGFSEAKRREFFARLRDVPPLEKPPADGPKNALWCESGLKCLVRYFEKTETGKLRGPVYQGVIK